MKAIRSRRRFRRVVVSVCLFLIVAAITGLPVYVLPQVDQPRHADAIFILGGPDHRRYSYGFELGAQGWAPNVVVSNPNGADDPWLTRYCATPNREFDLYCFAPDPPTTKGEGREARSDERGATDEHLESALYAPDGLGLVAPFDDQLGNHRIVVRRNDGVRVLCIQNLYRSVPD